MKTKLAFALGFAMTSFIVNAQNVDSQVISDGISPEVLVSVQKAASDKRVVAFDIVSDGQVAGFDFEVQIPGLIESSVNAKSCVSELPKGFNGACRVNKDSIVITAIGNGVGDFLAGGLVSVGKISYAVEANAAKGAQAAGVTISSMYLSDSAGQKKVGHSKVLEQ